MKHLVQVALALTLAAVIAGAQASPIINGAVVKTRIFNDAPDSTVTYSNLYPGSLWIEDANLYRQDGGFANRHNFRLSDNGGISEAVFLNHDPFSFAADVTLTGPANSEGGLNLSPWWSKDVDGVFMINAASGEIACFGGRLPFYSFTSNFGLTYTKGTTVRLGLVYNPHNNTQDNPATIQYSYIVGGQEYDSPVLAFDEGNPNEDPPYGLWGILNDARLGGYFQPQVSHDDPNNWGRIDFGNMVYTPIPEPATLVLLSLAGLAMLRRR